MQVTHRSEDKVQITMSREEVAMLVDLCHAAAFSDLLPQRRESQVRVQRFVWDVQNTLFDAAQSVWQAQRHLTMPVAAARRRSSAAA
ncbi:MAG: hypothetical protein QUV04_08885 [Synechococcus sp. WH 8007]|nr:hypothetical protein [Synechococcus sp. WH 8007]